LGPGHFFASAKVDVVDGVTLLKGTTVDPNKGQHALLWVVDNLEGHGAKVCGRVVPQEPVVDIFRGRKVIDDGVHERLDGNVLVGAAARRD